MINSLKYLLAGMILALVLLVSCEDEKFTSTIFDDSTEPYLTSSCPTCVPVDTIEGPLIIYMDTTKHTYKLDRWLYENYMVPYNLEFKYKMQDVGSDTEYNLVPAKMELSDTLAHLAHYLWFDVYSDMVNEDFLKLYGPRMIHLIGSPAINAAQGTIVLGTAEGGIKITLYYVNILNPRDVDLMNEYYFKTMHHEFAHILHQTKTYPKDYASISSGKYDPSGWQLIPDTTAYLSGFVSNYSMSQVREDFVEVIANYIVKSDEDWNSILAWADKGVISVSSGDTITAKDIIEQKWNMCYDWLKEQWNIDLNALRNEVQTRQNNMDMQKVMNDDY